MVSREQRTGAVHLAVVAVAYFATARVGYAGSVGGTVTLWPPSGLMLGLLAMSPLPRWPWLIAGAITGSMASDLWSGYSLPLAIFAAAANALDAGVGAWILRRVLGSPVRFTTVRAVVVLSLFVVVASNAATAWVGAAMLHVGFAAPPLWGWFVWWAGDGLGMLIVGPLVMAWTEVVRQRERLRPSQQLEAAVLLAALVSAAMLVLGPAHRLVPSGPYLLFPLLLWAALGFGPVGASTANVIVAGIAVWHASHGRGPFAIGASGPAAAILETYAFLAVAGISSLLAATALAERKMALTELRRSRERYRNVVETATDAIVTIDRDSRIQFANAATERIFGHSAAELVGQPLAMLMPPDQGHQHSAGLARYLATGRRSIPWQGTALTGLHKDGRQVPLEVSFGELVEPGRHEFTGILRDITEKRASEAALRALEEQYRQSQKMEAIGELAGGIAHDFNNLLTVVQGNADMLIDEVGPGHRLRPQLEQIHAAGQRAAALTRKLLAFSRRQILAPRVVSLADSIAAVAPMLRRLIGEQVTVEIRVPGPVTPIIADPGQIEQVILNLAINARDAMPHGGTLTIELTEETFDEQLAGAVDLRPGRFACLAVRDTGVGMSSETAARVFEPFFTTKPIGHGTGLGLSTAHGIVKQSGGGIRVSSEPGHGSTFHLCFPVVDAPIDSPVAAEPAALPAVGRATILIVEDEADVGRLTRRILERAGYRVLLASGPSEALEIAARERDIQLLLSDVVLPEMSGRILASRLLSTHPGLVILYMSGYTNDALSHHGVLDAGIALIEKPFSAAALLARIDSMLRENGIS